MLREIKVLRVFRDLQVLPVVLVLWEPKVHKGHKDKEEIKVLKEHKVPRGQKGPKGTWDQLVLKGN